ncbi:MAG: DMT family transporter [Chloroflexota bacterium]
MNGILLSIASGIGFGLFQALNRRAGRNSNPYQATFVLLLASSVVLTLVSLLFEDVRLLQGIAPLAIVYFTLAACIHFVVGWTLFSISQQKVGAARTGILLGTVPLWAIVIGVVLFAELLSVAILSGILLMIVGAYVVSTDPAKASGAQIETGLKASLYGLGTAVCFAGSSIFIRYGLELLASPLLGVTIGMLVATVIYAVMFRARMATSNERITLASPDVRLQIVAGVLVAVATWWRWIAIDLTPIAIVISLSRLSIPTVLILSPLIIGQKYEQVNRRIWLGAAVIIVGAMILTFR